MDQPKPQYLRLKHHIQRHINNGDWQPLTRIPSESELVAKFGVSRMTANRALRELMDAGIITRVQGVGSFVAKAKVESTMLEVRSIRDEILARGQSHSVDVLVCERVVARKSTAVRFELPAGTRLFHSRLVHLADGEPLEVEDRFVNPECAPDYLTIDFHVELPHQYLMRSAPLQKAEHVIEAEVASREFATLLGVMVGDPLLMLSRRTWSRGKIATYVRFAHPARRYRYFGTFQVGNNSPPLE